MGIGIVAEWVEDWPTAIRDGRIYVIVLEDDIIIKRINNRIKPKGYLVCQSDNSRLQSTFIIKPEDVREVWHFKMNMTTNASNPMTDLYTRVADIEADIAALTSKFKN